MDLIDQTREYVSEVLADEPSSHDMHHIERVEKVCMRIREKEGGDEQVLRLAALLHDVGIVKEHQEGGDHAQYSAEIAQEFLTVADADKDLIEHVTACIRSHRFSRRLEAQTLEAKILQDADRIDALGAVGIFRSLVSMGALRVLRLSIGTIKETSMNAYNDEPLEGFYEYMEKKPFKILERLNTGTARKIAEERLKIMHAYLDALKEETCYIE
ncbi:putative domain HDIG-containing protein [Methanomethylovorans hollandica DSM 15978]|uniref:Putative domain HDIG-containing protein n=1 Tax=Methanomethylovorans hollandica (strain DSM 15978 / NBRC 107637 / DMS1) TaxID=867904 RepID=L0KZG7_METHD|nr:HD domain-containing protein [Methanomethylovorans hollandica]AGB50090.1 putative domain HDIG-containing protein [Methanomethylovorans hollandica DSM 15978]